MAIDRDGISRPSILSISNEDGLIDGCYQNRGKEGSGLERIEGLDFFDTNTLHEQALRYDCQFPHPV